MSVTCTGQWFSPGTSISSINKTDRHDITEILMKVALDTQNRNAIPSTILIISQEINKLYK